LHDVDHVVDRHVVDRVVVRARVRPQVADDDADPLHPLRRVLHDLVHGIEARGERSAVDLVATDAGAELLAPFREQREAERHPRSGVVDLVSDGARELTDGHHLVGLDQHRVRDLQVAIRGFEIVTRRDGSVELVGQHVQTRRDGIERVRARDLGALREVLACEGDQHLEYVVETRIVLRHSECPESHVVASVTSVNMRVGTRCVPMRRKKLPMMRLTGDPMSSATAVIRRATSSLTKYSRTWRDCARSPRMSTRTPRRRSPATFHVIANASTASPSSRVTPSRIVARTKPPGSSRNVHVRVAASPSLTGRA
jgi:hypothetical protein